MISHKNTDERKKKEFIMVADLAAMKRRRKRRIHEGGTERWNSEYNTLARVIVHGIFPWGKQMTAGERVSSRWRMGGGEKKAVSIPPGRMVGPMKRKNKKSN